MILPFKWVMLGTLLYIRMTRYRILVFSSKELGLKSAQNTDRESLFGRQEMDHIWTISRMGDSTRLSFIISYHLTGSEIVGPTNTWTTRRTNQFWDVPWENSDCKSASQWVLYSVEQNTGRRRWHSGMSDLHQVELWCQWLTPTILWCESRMSIGEDSKNDINNIYVYVSTNLLCYFYLIIL